MKNPYIVAIVVAVVLLVASIAYRMTADSRKENAAIEAQAKAAQEQVEKTRRELMERSKIDPYTTPSGHKIVPITSPPPSQSYWPPTLDGVYPDLELVDQTGMKFRLSDLRGHVILLQTVGMNDAVSQSYVDGAGTGGYMGISTVGGPDDIRKSFQQITRMKWPNSDVVFVQLLLYDTKRQHPKPEDAQKWAQHFGLDKARGEIVAVNSYDLRAQVTFSMVPGFHLIDRDFVLRVTSTGMVPKTNLYTGLLPYVNQLVR